VGDEIRSYLASGTLVPDRVVGGLVQSRLDRSDCGRGFLLDGFPRNLEQLALLDALLAEMGRGLERVVVIDVPDEVAVARLTSGPASVIGEHRDDVVRTRIASYRQHAAAVIDVYRDRGLLLELDGDREANEVTESVIRAVGTPVVA
jgi:adenylate kinase